MRSIIKKCLIIICIVTVCILVFIWISGGEQVYSDFNPEIKRILSEQYGIIVPDSASFVEGKNVEFARDPFLLIIFDVPYNDYVDIFKKGWWNESKINAAFGNEIGVKTKVSDTFDGKHIKEYVYFAVCDVTKLYNAYFRVDFYGDAPSTGDYKI